MRRVRLMVILVFMAACAGPESNGRVQLARMRVTFSPDEFIVRVRNGEATAVKAFLDAGMDPNTRGKNGETALMLSLEAGRLDVAKQLVERGAHSWVQDDKWSPLMLASFLGATDVVKEMLDGDANIAATNVRGMSALTFAASWGHTAIVQELVAKGADIDSRDAGGHTALMFAANNGYADTVRALLDLGARRALKSKSGRTALAYARLNYHRNIEAMLQAAGAASQ